MSGQHANFEEELKSIFFEEAEELLDSMVEALKKLMVSENEKEAIDSILRDLHTLKGNTRTIGFKRLGNFIQYVELFCKTLLSDGTSLEKVKELEVNIDTIFNCINKKTDCDFNIEIPKQKKFRCNSKTEQEELRDIFNVELNEILIQISECLCSWVISFDPDWLKKIAHCATNIKTGALLAGLQDISDQALLLTQHVKDQQSKKLTDDGAGFCLIVEELISNFSRYLGENGILPRETPVEYVQMPATDTSQESEDLVRVKSRILERFGKNLTSLNISRTHLSQQILSNKSVNVDIKSKLKLMKEEIIDLQIIADTNHLNYYGGQDSLGKHDFDELELDQYSHVQKLIRHLRDLVSDVTDLNEASTQRINAMQIFLNEQKHSSTIIEDDLGNIRMMPIQSIRPRLERVVRQISAELDKTIDLKFNNFEGDLDRVLINSLVSPLEHLIRNAIDHGIESEDIRNQKNKVSHGTLEITFNRLGDRLELIIRDDGRGLSLSTIREKALQLKMIDKDDILSSSELYELILQPGFTTKRNVSEISGQGVGMDVVNNAIAKIGGKLCINSEEGVYTEFCLVCPAQLTLKQVLVFELRHQMFAVPIGDIVGVGRFQSVFIEGQLKDRSKIDYIGNQYTICYLGEPLGLGEFSIGTEMKTVCVYFIKSQNHQFAFVIDKILGTREILVQPVNRQLQFVKEVQGASLLGDGRIVLVLDPLMVAEQMSRRKTTSQKTKVISNDKYTILIVDDSATIRTACASLLKRNHYMVECAQDGLEALKLLDVVNPNLILLDIEMPVLDGYSFLEEITKTVHAAIPVVVVSSRTQDKHMKKAFELGAKEFLTKPYQEDVLLAAIQSFQGSYENDVSK